MSNFRKHSKNCITRRNIISGFYLRLFSLQAMALLASVVTSLACASLPGRPYTTAFPHPSAHDSARHALLQPTPSTLASGCSRSPSPTAAAAAQASLVAVLQAGGSIGLPAGCTDPALVFQPAGADGGVLDANLRTAPGHLGDYIVYGFATWACVVTWACVRPPIAAPDGPPAMCAARCLGARRAVSRPVGHGRCSATRRCATLQTLFIVPTTQPPTPFFLAAADPAGRSRRRHHRWGLTAAALAARPGDCFGTWPSSTRCPASAPR